MLLRMNQAGSVLKSASRQFSVSAMETPIKLTVLDSTTHPYAQIGVLSLNRPKARNALSKALLETLDAHLEAMSNNQRIRGVILESATQGMFCAGADLVERRTMTPVQVSQILNLLRSTFTKLSQLSVPTISIIDGHALGGGLEIALCTDIRIAGPHAKVGLPETKLGIIPGAGGTQRLTRLIGPSRAKEMIFAAQILDGKAAFAKGIVDYHSDQPRAKALDLMEAFIQNSPTGISQAKQAIEYATEGHELNKSLDYERQMYEICMDGPDRNEGLLAFKEKRRPIYGVPDQLSIKSKI